MGIKENFNKIINLYFLDKNGLVKDSIVCPTQGRKPEIEIVGTFQPSEAGGALPAFTITVTNLYTNLIGFQYPMIIIEAGYKGNLIKFKGSIISMFTESPGPDGKTIISCYLGAVENWLNSYIDVSVTAGATLKDLITKVSDGLGFTSAPQIPAELQTLTLPADFAENGTASEIIKKIYLLFPEYKLEVSELNEKLYVYSLGSIRKGIKRVQVDYLSSPPQKNPGDQNGAYYTVFTAPWNPAVLPGVKVVFPAWQYIKFFNLVNANIQNNAIIAQFVQVHFSTTGSINQMQVQGMGVEA